MLIFQNISPKISKNKKTNASVTTMKSNQFQLSLKNENLFKMKPRATIFNINSIVYIDVKMYL